MGIKPILFNTEMVKAILDGRKTQTRRIAKPLCNLTSRSDSLMPDQFDFFISPFTGTTYWKDNQGSVTIDGNRVIAPFTRRDTLYVRETWVFDSGDEDYGTGCFMYKADMPIHIDAKDTAHGDDVDITAEDYKWRPSIHMPKEAARIFLRVKDVRVERLQKCGSGWCIDIENEGVKTPQDPILYVNDDKFHDALRTEMEKLWNSTIKKADLPVYGWDANPWVWVIEFERCVKPEGWCKK